MAITDYKITQGEVDDNKVESAPDVLSDTPTNNKKIFDQLVKVFIAKYNDLIDNINSDFVDSSEFAEGLTVTDKVRWRYALTKGTSIGLNFSGNITQITTGFRTIVGDIDGLTENDFMDCYLSINDTDYECGDSYTSGNSILTSAVINGVTVEIIYDTTNGNITLEHATNPLDTLYWNVSIYRSVAERVPRKALPASVSNDGYTELNDRLTEVEDNGKWHEVELDKSNALPDTEYIETKETNKHISVASGATGTYTLAHTPVPEYTVRLKNSNDGNTYILDDEHLTISFGDGAATWTVTLNDDDLEFSHNLGNARTCDFSVYYSYAVLTEDMYVPVMRRTVSDKAYLIETPDIFANNISVESLTIAENVSVTSGGEAHDASVDISKTGYTAIAVVGHAIEGSTGVYFYRCYVNPTTQKAAYYLRNVNQSTATVTVKMDILYIKN